MLEAIDRLPGDEREAFGLARIQRLTSPEAAGVLGLAQDGAAAVEPRPGGARSPVGRPPPVVGARRMADPRVQHLLDELLDTDATPEQVCRDCPELLPEVREQWRR